MNQTSIFDSASCQWYSAVELDDGKTFVLKDDNWFEYNGLVLNRIVFGRRIEDVDTIALLDGIAERPTNLANGVKSDMDEAVKGLFDFVGNGGIVPPKPGSQESALVLTVQTSQKNGRRYVNANLRKQGPMGFLPPVAVQFNTAKRGFSNTVASDATGFTADFIGWVANRSSKEKLSGWETFLISLIPACSENELFRKHSAVVVDADTMPATGKRRNGKRTS